MGELFVQEPVVSSEKVKEKAEPESKKKINVKENEIQMEIKKEIPIYSHDEAGGKYKVFRGR